MSSSNKTCRTLTSNNHAQLGESQHQQILKNRIHRHQPKIQRFKSSDLSPPNWRLHRARFRSALQVLDLVHYHHRSLQAWCSFNTTSRWWWLIEDSCSFWCKYPAFTHTRVEEVEGLEFWVLQKDFMKEGEIEGWWFLMNIVSLGSLLDLGSSWVRVMMLWHWSSGYCKRILLNFIFFNDFI